MQQLPDSAFSTIESIIRSTGERVTPCRKQIFGILQSAQGPQSHNDIEERLKQNGLPGIDRVTIYRVLDWLVDVGLAHKAANARGVFCFIAAQQYTEHKQHSHFHCTSCGNVICLDAPRPTPPDLPNGFRLNSVEFDLSGECSDCAA